MLKFKSAELYAVLLVLCTALVVFGMFQMKAFVSATMAGLDIYPLEMILSGVQVSALGLVLSAGILLVFLKRLRKAKASNP